MYIKGKQVSSQINLRIIQMMLLQVSQGKTIGKALLVSDDLIFALSIVRSLKRPALKLCLSPDV